MRLRGEEEVSFCGPRDFRWLSLGGNGPVRWWVTEGAQAEVHRCPGEDGLFPASPDGQGQCPRRPQSPPECGQHQAALDEGTGVPPTPEGNGSPLPCVFTDLILCPKLAK